MPLRALCCKIWDYGRDSEKPNINLIYYGGGPSSLTSKSDRGMATLLNTTDEVEVANVEAWIQWAQISWMRLHTRCWNSKHLWPPRWKHQMYFQKPGRQTTTTWKRAFDKNRVFSSPLEHPVSVAKSIEHAWILKKRTWPCSCKARRNFLYESVILDHSNRLSATRRVFEGRLVATSGLALKKQNERIQ